MFSEVYIPQITCCLRAPLKLYSEGPIVLRDHIKYICGAAAIEYWRERDSWHFNQKLDSEDDGKQSKRSYYKNPLVRGESRGLSMELPTKSLIFAWASL